VIKIAVESSTERTGFCKIKRIFGEKTNVGGVGKKTQHSLANYHQGKNPSDTCSSMMYPFWPC
jgi:hypothetical protein